jgi:hypothetical protein
MIQRYHLAVLRDNEAVARAPGRASVYLPGGHAMKETRFSVHKVCTVDGHEIRVEKRSLFFTMEYSLIIDGAKQDQLLGTYGLFVLHGIIDKAGAKVPVEILIEQRWWSTAFRCKVAGQVIEMQGYTP